MKDKTFFIDTNVILYCYAQDDPSKQSIALNVASNAYTFVSTQVIKETCNILHKKVKLTWSDIALVVDEISENNNIIQVKLPTIKKAVFLADRYQLQWFDSVIIASALEANCDVLYSEDLQNGFRIEGLKIINPFK